MYSPQVPKSHDDVELTAPTTTLTPAFLSLLNLEIYSYSNRSAGLVSLGFAFVSFLAIDLCGLFYSSLVRDFMISFASNQSTLTSLCQFFEFLFKVLGAFLVSISIFSSGTQEFYFSSFFRTNLQMVYFLATVLNLVSTLLIILFWPTFLTPKKPFQVPCIFKSN